MKTDEEAADVVSWTELTFVGRQVDGIRWRQWACTKQRRLIVVRGNETSVLPVGLHWVIRPLLGHSPVLVKVEMVPRVARLTLRESLLSGDGVRMSFQADLEVRVRDSSEAIERVALGEKNEKDLLRADLHRRLQAHARSTTHQELLLRPAEWGHAALTDPRPGHAVHSLELLEISGESSSTDDATLQDALKHEARQPVEIRNIALQKEVQARRREAELEERRILSEFERELAREKAKIESEVESIGLESESLRDLRRLELAKSTAQLLAERGLDALRALQPDYAHSEVLKNAELAAGKEKFQNEIVRMLMSGRLAKLEGNSEIYAALVSNLFGIRDLGQRPEQEEPTIGLLAKDASEPDEPDNSGG